jgi:hypothetical protein
MPVSTLSFAGHHEALAGVAGYRIAALRQDEYRHGVFAALFPNRLEIAMRWEPMAG